MCGCSEKYEEAIVYFELLEKPKTLDPQTAQDDSELLIIRNIYEGLMRETDTGEIVEGACESYVYNNLTYTFTLRDNVSWSNGDKLTAYDFEYAFRRAVDPKINAPFASRLFAIENAKAIASGTADVSALGVRATDEKTLVIKLCQEDNDFLKTLATSVCMPCNEKFFDESIGKYGLDAKCIISNGSYRLTKWNKEEFGIRIYKNEEYTGDFKAKNAAVFISCIDNEAQVARLGGESDIAFVGGAELDNAKNAGLETTSVQNVCWVMTISRNFSSEVRRALAAGFSTDVYSESLALGYSAAKSIYPEVLGIKLDGVGITPYNINESKSIMSAQVAAMEDKKFPPSVLYYYNEDGAKELATSIVGHWQQNLSTFINIKSADNLEALQNEIHENELEFALFPITAKSEFFSEYAKQFTNDVSVVTPDQLQQQLLSDYTIIPVAYQDTNISYISTLEGIVVGDDNGYIDFSYIIKR